MKRGIVLMNLGSPASTSVRDVRKYLAEFLMDEKVIDLPYLARLLLVRGIIVPFRAPKSAKAYESVWTAEGSPLVVITRDLQQALQERADMPVAIAMRYGGPSPKEAYDDLLRRFPGLEEVLLVPLYPHYAMSSYETAVAFAEEQYNSNAYPFRLSILPPFYREASYLQAMTARMREYLKQDYDHILFSFHGVPERHILKADRTGGHCLRSENCCTTAAAVHDRCYRHQCLVTVQELVKRLNIPEMRYSYSFQSRLGRDEWLKPYTAKRLTEMPGEGIKKLLVVCPAFVSDCLETLEEIEKEGREQFLHAGGESFTMIPCLNAHPAWVETLAGWCGDGTQFALKGSR